MRYQLDLLQFRESDRDRLVGDPAVIVVQQVHHRTVEPIERRVVRDRHIERLHDLSLLFCFDASMLELDELSRCVAHDQVGFKQHVQLGQASVRHQLQEGIQSRDSSIIDASSAAQHKVERR